MNPAKRRRLNDTALTISKPFRSPLKVTPKCLSSQVVKTSTDQQTLDSRQATPSTAATLGTARAHEVGEKDIASHLTEDVIALQKQHSAMAQRLRKLKQDLDAVEQALNIQSSGQDTKLNEQILKWRSVARDAADEIFESASSRVRDMGGLQAWQKQSSQDESAGSDWFSSHQVQPVSDAVDNSDEDNVKKDDGARPYARRIDDGTTQADEHFSMNIMLRQLNINPGLLGFDEIDEQWTD